MKTVVSRAILTVKTNSDGPGWRLLVGVAEEEWNVTMTESEPGMIGIVSVK